MSRSIICIFHPEVKLIKHININSSINKEI